ncbi:hypothetical protein [Rhodococcus sp. UNC363MFTsu5.1]|uniref:hypothetical protein n=1 Tax=Rhodococcus sp. UNC363MFTsu5.1 TaxID=1449069 RepID=UPI000A6A7D34|nr:hypothetical protein [Rhodococcus sp. UNC363MFTsu5.1]
MTETFGAAGTRLHEALTDDGDSFAIGVLVIEASRIADRLAELERVLSGDNELWMRLTAGRDGVLEVRVDSPLQEARQQASVLRQLIAEVRRQKGLAGPEQGPDGLDDL